MYFEKQLLGVPAATLLYKIANWNRGLLTFAAFEAYFIPGFFIMFAQPAQREDLHLFGSEGV